MTNKPKLDAETEAVLRQIETDGAAADPAPPTPPIRSASTRGDGDETVVVGCKLPAGLDLGNGIILRGTRDESATKNGGFGITEGVNKPYFDAWMWRNKELSFVRRGLIISGADRAEVEAQAKEAADVASGFEQLNPADLPDGLETDADAEKRRLSEG